jgi:hypothetical protein
MRSKMCERGRKLRQPSVPSNGMAFIAAITLE